MCQNYSLKPSQTEVNSGVPSPLWGNTYIPWVGVSGALREQHRNYLTILSKFYLMPFFGRPVLFAITEYLRHFGSIQIRRRHIIRWAGRGIGTKQVRSRSWLWAWMRSVPSHWSHLSLLAENCFRCRQFSMAKPWHPVQANKHAITLKQRNRASNLNPLVHIHTGQCKQQCSCS